MKEPYNYLRKAIPQLKERNKRLVKQNPKYVAHVNDIIQAAQKAVKFVMPVNGRIFETNFSGLPEIVKLPFKTIVIEYEVDSMNSMAEEVFGPDVTKPAMKRIVYAEQQNEAIIIASIVAFQEPSGDLWQVQPFFTEILPKGVVPDDASVEDIPQLKDYGRLEELRVRLYDMGGMAQYVYGDDWERHAYVDMNDESSAVLSLIEALTCRNVSFEALPVKKNKGAQMRGALPFDEYHTLIVNARNRASDSSEDQGGTHRSPREHLRRGHIRRLPTGNVWVNSTIVNAGFHGKVIKSYEVAA